MQEGIFIGKSGKTDIKYKKEKYVIHEKNGREIVKFKDTDKMIPGHQGGVHLTGRILRPSEFVALQNVIKNNGEELTNLNCILLLGARYEECKRIQKHKEWFEGSFVTIDNTKVKSIEASGAQRHIRLSHMGKIELRHFFETKYLPTVGTYNEKLKRWAYLAKIDERHISVRMLRKTLESWLFACYPKYALMIVKSQGHTEATALDHYVDTKFENRDIQEMKPFIEGWRPKEVDW